MKMLGQNIRYKALKTILKQVWVRNGVFNNVGLINDCYFITFSNKDYQDHALLLGCSRMES